MTIVEMLRDSPDFAELAPQSGGSVCFQVIRGGARLYGASVYVARDSSEFHIREQALENGRFPNNGRLYEFVLANSHGTVCGAGNPSYAYRLDGKLLADVIELIRGGSAGGRQRPGREGP